MCHTGVMGSKLYKDFQRWEKLSQRVFDITNQLLERCNTSVSNPPPSDTDDVEMSVGCLGGRGEVKASKWSALWTDVKLMCYMMWFPVNRFSLSYKFLVIYSYVFSFSAGGSCSRERHFTARGQLGAQKSNGTIYSIVKKKYFNLSPFWGFEPQAVSPNKAIPIGWRVSCTPLSACLFSRPEERCSADCPYFGLALWYLGVSSYHFFPFFFFVFDETRIVDI